MVARPALGHQRTLSSGVSRVNSTRSLASSRSASPPRAASSHAPAPQSPVVRSRLGSPVKRSPSIPLQARAGLARRPSLQSEAASPTAAKVRNLDVQGSVASPAYQPLLPSLLSTSPLQSSALRQVASPPPGFESESDELRPEPETPTISAPVSTLFSLVPLYSLYFASSLRMIQSCKSCEPRSVCWRSNEQMTPAICANSRHE